MIIVFLCIGIFLLTAAALYGAIENRPYRITPDWEDEGLTIWRRRR